jgi:hypothetical protein
MGFRVLVFSSGTELGRGFSPRIARVRYPDTRNFSSREKSWIFGKMLNEEIHRPLRCQSLQGVGAGMRIASFCFSSAFLMLCYVLLCTVYYEMVSDNSVSLVSKLRLV